MKIYVIKNKITGLYFDGVNCSAEIKNAKPFTEPPRPGLVWSNCVVEEWTFSWSTGMRTNVLGGAS